MESTLIHGECLAEISRLYTEENWSLRDIAKYVGVCHHTIKRRLVSQGITITRARRTKPLTDEHKRKLRGVKRRPRMARVVMSEAHNRSNQIRKLKTSLDLSVYADFEKLKFLTRTLSRHRRIYSADAHLNAFLERFWDDAAFNHLYATWLDAGKDKWLRPTLDHKQPKSRGGSWDISNLQMLSWFENRAKADMTEAEWAAFLTRTKTTSTLFIERT